MCQLHSLIESVHMKDVKDLQHYFHVKQKEIIRAEIETAKRNNLDVLYQELNQEILSTRLFQKMDHIIDLVHSPYSMSDQFSFLPIPKSKDGRMKKILKIAFKTTKFASVYLWKKMKQKQKSKYGLSAEETKAGDRVKYLEKLLGTRTRDCNDRDDHCTKGKVEEIYIVYLDLESIIRFRLVQEGVRNVPVTKVMEFHEQVHKAREEERRQQENVNNAALPRKKTDKDK